MLRPGLHTHSRPRAKSPLSTASCLPTTQPAPHPLRPGLSQKWTQSKPSRPARRQPGEWPRRGWLGGTTGSFDVLPEVGDLFPQRQEEGVGLAGAWRHLNVRDIDKPPPTQASTSGRTSSCPVIRFLRDLLGHLLLVISPVSQSLQWTFWPAASQFSDSSPMAASLLPSQ